MPSYSFLRKSLAPSSGTRPPAAPVCAPAPPARSACGTVYKRRPALRRAGLGRNGCIGCLGRLVCIGLVALFDLLGAFALKGLGVLLTVLEPCGLSRFE